MKDNTEEKILKAAKDVFVRKGLDGARMQEIADEAGINKALLNYYFRSKQNLFDAIFEDAFIKLIPIIVEPIDLDIPFTEKMKRIISNHFDMISANPFIPLFVLHEASRDPNRLASLMAEKGGIRPDNFRQVVEKEVKSGNIREISFDNLMLNIVSMTVMTFAARPILQRLYFDNDETRYEAFIAQRKQAITDFVINSIQKK